MISSTVIPFFVWISIASLVTFLSIFS